jgi:hypothetical protein
VTVLGRLGFGAAVLAAVVLVLEVAFRVGGLWVGATPAPAPDGSLVVLCVGDSHTRGRPDPDNYPAELERILNERTGHRWRVINLGVPGQNTGQVRRRFERYLAYYRPAVVLHWGGVNNDWNHAEREDLERGALERLADHSRLVRMVRVAVFYRGLGKRVLDVPVATGHDWGSPNDGVRVNFAGTDEDIPRRPGPRLPLDTVAALSRDDLMAMMTLAWDRGVPMYLVAYSWWADSYRPINDAVKAVSEHFRVPYVDSALAVEAAARVSPGEKLFDAWVHPMPVVYRQVAELAYETLREQGVLRARAPRPPA